MLCERAMTTILFLSVLAATLVCDAAGQNCQAATGTMSSNEHLIFAAGNYVGAMQDMCSNSIMASLREDVLSGPPESDVSETRSSSATSGEEPPVYLCKTQYDAMTEVITLKFDGSVAEEAADLKDEFKYACEVDAGGNFCVISFSGGAVDDEEIELFLDYEGLAICIPTECENSPQDVETLTMHFLKEGGFFGFETGIDISDMGSMPTITCDNGDVIGPGTGSDTASFTGSGAGSGTGSGTGGETPLIEIAAVQNASPASTTSAASSLWSPVYFVQTALVLATVAFFFE